MTKEIEILARAIDPLAFDRQWKARMEIAVDQVRAVLRALRDNVTDGMLDAAYSAAGIDDEGGLERADAGDEFRVMLSHLLEEE